ncbi:MAG: hypothetical protein HY331_08565 [Chloroflexi bacterium]|nr:hypothetical protein [Chloroflexota bacterium]
MSPLNYFPKIALTDADGNRFEFVSELVTTVRPFQFTLWVYRNGDLYARRTWPKGVPLQGQVRNFAEGFVANPAYQERFLVRDA